MILFCSAGLLGMLLALYVPSLQYLEVMLYVLLACKLLIFIIAVRGAFARRMVWPAVGLIIGVSASYGAVLTQLGSVLPEHLEKQPLELDGCISDVLRVSNESTRFVFDIQNATPSYLAHERIILTDYTPRSTLQPGHCYALSVVLKRPHGQHGFFGFDYEQYLFSRQIIATGYVKAVIAERTPVARLSSAWQQVQQYRYALAEQIYRADRPESAVVVNLITGIRHYISDAQWHVFRTTGTAHLMAISGFHVSLIFLVGYWVSRLCSALVAWFRPVGNALIPANVLGLLCSGSYAVFTGLSISTQRAWMMLAVMVVLALVQLRQSGLQRLLIAVSVVALIDPLALLAPGFWLSAICVAVLIYSAAFLKGVWWQSQYRMHAGLFLALSPFSWFWFGGTSLISPVINFIYLPIFVWVQVPLILLDRFIGVWDNDWLLQSFAWSYALMEWVAGRSWTFFEFTLVALWQWLALVLGAVVAMLPVSVCIRLCALLLCALPFFSKPKIVPPGTAEVFIFDVGQASSAVVFTANQTTVIDTGTAQAAEHWFEGHVWPLLVRYGRDHIDQLVVSHWDDDHGGGTNTLLASMPVARVWAPRHAKSPLGTEYHCDGVVTTQTDGVVFSVFSAQGMEQENDASCLLKVQTAGGSMLFSGDIEKRAEYRLIDSHPKWLAADVLVTPHHGSISSSSPRFLHYVDPKLAITSAGYLNRFGFPDKRIVNRFDRFDIHHVSTAEVGSVHLKLQKTPFSLANVAYSRRLVPRLWHFHGDGVLKLNN